QRVDPNGSKTGLIQHATNASDIETQPSTRVFPPQKLVIVLLKIRQCKSATRHEYPCHISNSNIRIQTMVENHIPDYRINGRIRYRDVFHISNLEFNILTTEFSS